MNRESGPTIRLAQFLKWKGIAESGGEAKTLIQEGLVMVNDEIETRRGRQLRNGDSVTFAEEVHQVELPTKG